MSENRKTAIITGSSRGIGAAIALRLAKDGYNIALNDLNESMFENNDIKEKISALGVEVEVFLADVSKYDQCEAMVKAVKERFGTIDVLINNAGITRDGLMARMPEEQYDMVIAVNQKSVFNMLKFAGNVMIRQKQGKIVNLASVAGLYGNPGQINYSASKAAIIGMTKTAAKELGSRNINVNAVAPGFISTPMTDKLTEEQKAKMLEAIAMKRYGTVDEIAGVVSFLCSEDASYVTGQTIEISGGLSM
ncbi:MAG: 3-oxoacyl-[acyl-carrier-protein] reductase [Oscillospiraceae bacterium]|nr:3-oxoacyl-[acyl-carrier-protein] reductase [Oscillospiraceae bacterium]